MRARIAEHSVELIGCDTMHNADKFARFPCTFDHTDCRIEVTVQKERLCRKGTFLDRVGDWSRFSFEDGLRLCHRSHTMVIETDEAFSHIHLFLSTAMPQMETVLYLQVQQMLCCHLLHSGGTLIHSAGLRLSDKGILLCGRSGVGKSTMSRLLREIDPQIAVLCEDMPALMQDESGIVLHGTPFCGQDTQCESGKAPLKTIVLLRQSSQNRIGVPSKEEAIYELLTVVPRAVYAQDIATAATDLVVAMVQQIPVVIFENDGTPTAAQTLLRYLQTEAEDGS